MTMDDAMIRSTVAEAVERFAAYVGAAPHTASRTPSSPRFSAPTSCDMISRIHVKARWLIRMLAWVRATLDDAEDMDITEESVRHWLRQLQDAADAAEGVLDDFSHEALRLGFVGAEADAPSASPPEASTPPTRAGETTLEMMAVRGQLRFSSSPTYPLEEVSAFLRHVEKRIEKIASRFVEIEKPEQALEHEHSKGQTQAETTSAGRTTSSVMEEPHIVGRQEELAKIKQFLLSSDAEEEEESRGSGGDMDNGHVSVTAIVGMGGLGKTTLAQLAYNDAQVNQHFQLKAWVCVSEDFDVIRLTEAILQCLEKKASGLSELDPLQQKLMQKLEGKPRFLLMLDDVWEAENLNIHNWNLLTAPLRYISADTKIIMTTRSKKVSEMVATNSTCQLGFLSDEDTLELFMLHAFGGRDPSLYRNLVAIGVNITRKCGGVPLVAKTLGGLLLSKDDGEWKKILESEAWNATINREDSIIPILRLSYQHLPAPLKRCFRYCSLFPKAYKFFRCQIINCWMAQGYIKTNRRKLMEETGERYIDDLLSRSFFQHSSSDYGDFQMHDLMHDLARCVSKDECYTVEGGDKPCPIPAHVRHLSVFLTGHHRTPIISSIKDISKTKSFKSFLLPDEKIYSSISHHELLSVPCTRMNHLRVLDVGCVLLYHFPKSITRLKHLRYLNLYVKELPQFVGCLYHLQTLHLKSDHYSLEVLNCISNLHKLRHLIIITPDCVRYPVGLGKLTDLQTMPSFSVSPKHNRAKLGELKELNSIRGDFAITGLENLSDVNEAKKACLNKKRDIRSLCLGWCRSADSTSHIDDEVLESLKPSVKLGSLKISGFKGPSYPSWLGDKSFSRLDIMKLEHCEKWISLPPLGRLPSLKSLCICEARAVEYIGSEFFSGGFTQLEELTLKDMHSWKSWCGAQKGECAKLKKLSIEGCNNLESLSLINLGAVEYISVSGCPKLQLMSLQLSHLPQKIKIHHVCEVRYISFLSPLDLQLEGVGQAEAEYMLGMCSHICRLTVSNCSNLTSLPSGNQCALEYVEIRECPRLQITSVSPQLWQLPSLQKIYVHGIHGAECIDLLKRSHLRLTNVDQLEASFLLNEFSHMIPCLTITQCANLMSLPLAKLTTLEYLEISECNQLQLSSCSLQLPQSSSMLEMKVQCIRSAAYIHGLFSRGGTDALLNSCLELTNVDQLEASFLLNVFSHMIRRLTITGCVNLTSLPWTALTTVEYLRIICCPSFQLLNVTPIVRQPVVTQCEETQTHIAFPRLQKLEFHYMPVWKEWSGTKEGDYPLLCKLILKHCPKLRALPPLPPSLRKLELEACHELTSLFEFGSNLTQSLKFLKSLGRLSLSATKGTPPILQRMSLTNCPLLLAWCEGHPRVLADIPNLLINGVPVHKAWRKHQVSDQKDKKERSQTGGTSRKMGPLMQKSNDGCTPSDVQPALCEVCG